MGAGLAGRGGACAREESPQDPGAAVEPKTSQQPGAPPAPSSRRAQVGADPFPVRASRPASAGRCSPRPWGLCVPRSTASVSRAVWSPPLSGAGSPYVSTVDFVPTLSLLPSLLLSLTSPCPRALSLWGYLSLYVLCVSVFISVSLPASLPPSLSQPLSSSLSTTAPSV